MKPFTTIAVGIFALVAATHACRIWQGWEIVIAGTVIPMWASYVGLVIAAGLATMVWRESRLEKP
jgi:hypothetical protein